MEGDLSLREVVNAMRHTKMFNTYAATKKKQTQRSYFMPLMLYRMVQWRSKFIPRHLCVCSCFKKVPRLVRQCFFCHSKRAHA